MMKAGITVVLPAFDFICRGGKKKTLGYNKMMVVTGRVCNEGLI